MKTLICHPYMGELGWELMLWQSHVRAVSRRFDETHVFCQKGHEFFYETATIHPFSVEGGKTDRHYRLLPYQVTFYHPNRSHMLVERGDGIVHMLPTKAELQHPTIKHEYRKYAVTKKKRSIIVVHARADMRKTIAGDRNWPIDKWIELVGMIHDAIPNMVLVSIGSNADAMHIPNTVDMRGESWELLTEILCGARMAMGPSSGPMHLASLCECPHLVWTDQNRWNLGMSRKGSNRERYESAWNPWGASVNVVDEFGWQPEPQEIFKQFILFWGSLYGDTDTQRQAVGNLDTV